MRQISSDRRMQVLAFKHSPTVPRGSSEWRRLIWEMWSRVRGAHSPVWFPKEVKVSAS